MARTGLIIDPGAGYAQVTDVDGSIVLDTRDQIFHVLSRLNGSVSRPSLAYPSVSQAGANRAANITLGAVDPNSQAILGFARIVYSTGYSQLPSGYWFALGGTLVPHMKAFQNVEGDWGSYPSSIALLSFVLNGGNVILEERIHLKDDRLANVAALAAFTITYRLYCGTFT